MAVVAKKDGQERTFSNEQWQLLGVNKKGWVQVGMAEMDSKGKESPRFIPEEIQAHMKDGKVIAPVISKTITEVPKSVTLNPDVKPEAIDTPPVPEPPVPQVPGEDKQADVPEFNLGNPESVTGKSEDKIPAAPKTKGGKSNG